MSIKNTLKTYLPFYKRNLALAIPVMLSQLGQSIVMLSDSIMTGQLGKTELAAATFANAVFVVGFVLAQGIGFGATPLIGQQYAEGHHKRAAELFQHALVVNLTTALVVGALMFFVSFHLDVMGEPAEVTRLATPYYRVLVISLVPYMLFLAFKQFLEGLGNTKYAMMITIISGIINIIFNYLLIFGKFGFPALGVVGAGVASLISRISMPILYLLLFRYKDSLWRNFKFFKQEYFNWKDFKKLGLIGLPIGFQMFMECFTFSLSAVMTGWFGETSLAAHSIAINISSLTFMVVTGISSATTIRVSHQYGANKMGDMKRAGNASFHITLVYSTICAILMYIFRDNIACVFNDSPDVIALGSTLLIYAAVYQLADGIQSVSLGALRGMSDVDIPMRLAIFCYIFVNLPISYIVGVKLNWGAEGVWLGFIFGLYAVAIVLQIRWWTKTRKLSKTSF